MFRKLLLAAALIASPAAADEQRRFDFMGLTTSATYSGERVVGGKKCKLKGQGEEECSRFGGGLIGTVLIMNLTTKFNAGRFFAASGTAYIAYAQDLKSAFIAKYGMPDVEEDRPWQNQMGANFSNEVSRWRFSDGVLEFRVRGKERDFSSFTFLANDNAPDRLKPKGQPVNF